MVDTIPSDDVSVISQARFTPVGKAMPPVRDDASLCSISSRVSTSSSKIFKSTPNRKDFCRITSGILQSVMDDDEMSCDSVHC
jgi:hypothetical protein